MNNLSKNRFKGSKVQMFKVFGVIVFSVLELLNPVNVEQTFAQANFYQGKTVRIVVGLTPGGFYDRWARLLARFMPLYIPGNPNFIVQNMAGAGSMIAMNHIYGVAICRRPCIWRLDRILRAAGVSRVRRIRRVSAHGIRISIAVDSIDD